MGMTINMQNGNCLCPEYVNLLKHNKLQHAGKGLFLASPGVLDNPVVDADILGANNWEGVV